MIDTKNRIGPSRSQAWRLTSDNQGTLLVYLVVVLLIFGVLGVSLVSLFTTSTSSSATPNDAKRALFIAESGIRYALSEIRNSPDLETAAELLNTTAEFKLGKNGSFTADVFSPGLQSANNYSYGGSGGSLILDVPYSGKFPEDFDVNNAVNDVYIVNWLDFKGTTATILPNSYALVTSSPDPGGAADVTLDVGDNINAGQGDTICFALLVTDAQTNIPKGSSIYVDEKAAEFFPEQNGAIRIFTPNNGDQYNYFYETRKAPSGGKVELANVREMPGDLWTPIADLRAGDYVILSPYNFRVFASGTSDETTVDVGKNRPFWAMARPSEYTIYMRELLQDKSIVQEGDVIRTQEAGDKKIELGRGSTGTEGFGDLWYGGDKSIGGNNNFCSQGRCVFDLGVRVFFTADVIPGANDGQGFTFALIAGGTLFTPVNTRISAGGDFKLPELLAYGGNSQLDNSPTYLDTTGDGLIPPKMAIEFDTDTNFDLIFNSTLAYCSGSDPVPDSRNDPKPENQLRDVVQYVFWGNNDPTDFNLPCRITPESYDDNRHDAEGDDGLSFNWLYDTGGMVISSPAVDKTGGPYDGTIYVGSNSNNLYAFKPDGTLKWTFPSTADIQSSPAIGTDGTIYVGSNNGRVYAIDPSDGSSKWSVDTGGAVISSPTIDLTGGPHSGTIYVGSGEESMPGNGKILAIRPNGSIKWQFVPTDPHSVGDLNVDSSPTVDENGNIYVGADTRVLYALNPDDRTAGLPFPTANEWFFPPLLPLAGGVESKPAISASKATVYFEAESFFLYAVNIATGVQRWALDIDRFGPVSDDSELESSPVIGPDGTIFVGSKDGRLYAVNHDDRLAGLPFPTAREWTFDTGGEVRSTPAIGGDGTIYVGSGSGRLFAINPDGTEKWQFPLPTTPAIGSVSSSPEVDSSSAIYFGSNDNNLYAISGVAVPINYRNTYLNGQRGFLTRADLDSTVAVDDPDNWLDGSPMAKGPWAVRTEIKRATSAIANGNYEYTLLTWIRQCSQSDCSDIKGTPFQDTTGEYLFLPGPPVPDLPFEQVIELTPAEHGDFERFLFGFTTAASATDTQTVEIRDFQLTFIQSGDPTIIADPTWLP